MLEWLPWVFLFLIAVIFHEVCHGWAALALGDPTARDQGRLSLNPLRHIDPFWTVLFPAALFLSTNGHFAIGMAKPVPVNFSRLRPARLGMVLVALAGPAANLLLAGVFNFLYKFSANEFFLYAIYFNLGVAMFNLVPVPPLDGSRILAGLLPDFALRWLMVAEPFGFILVFLLYMSGFLLYWVVPGMDFFCRILDVPGIQLTAG